MLKLSPEIEAQLKKGLPQGLDEPQPVPPCIQLRYDVPDTYDELTFRTETADYFQSIIDTFDDDWDDTCLNINQQDFPDISEVEPLPSTPYVRKPPTKSSKADCTESCVVSDHCLGYSLACHYQDTASEDFSIQFIYDRSAHRIYLSWMAADGESDSLQAILQLYFPLFADQDYRMIPDEIDGMNSAEFLPGALTENEAKKRIDDLLESDHDLHLPYVFFTKMLGYAYPLGRVSVNDSRVVIANEMDFMRGIAHVVMIETRELAAYLSAKLSARKPRGVKIPSAASGYVLITWPNYKCAVVLKPEDFIHTSGRSLLEPYTIFTASTLINLANDPDTQMTVDDVAKLAKQEKDEREKAIRESESYKALEAENEKLKAELLTRQAAPKTEQTVKDAAYTQALEEKCEELRIENGRLKIRNDALAETNAALRKKKAEAASCIVLSTDGITEMYDDEVYLQIMALLSDALQNLHTSGAIRRSEIVEGLLSANGYNGEMEHVHDALIRAAKTGRKDDLFSALSKYGVTVDNKEHPELHFKNGSAVQETISGTPSDRRALLNSAKHIAKSMF